MYIDEKKDNIICGFHISETKRLPVPLKEEELNILNNDRRLGFLVIENIA
jgi:hypothetical protein